MSGTAVTALRLCCMVFSYFLSGNKKQHQKLRTPKVRTVSICITCETMFDKRREIQSGDFSVFVFCFCFEIRKSYAVRFTSFLKNNRYRKIRRDVFDFLSLRYAGVTQGCLNLFSALFIFFNILVYQTLKKTVDKVFRSI